MHAFLKTGKLGAPAAEVKKPSTSQIKDSKKNLIPWVEK